MKNQSFSINIGKRCRLKINKLFLPVKIGLFCWFAGGFTLSVFLPVYLKSKGLTIVHLSLFAATSVTLHCLSNVLSGIIADKTGRSKPILMTYIAMSFLISLTFTQMPNVKECSAEKIQFQCNKENNEVSSLAIQASCNFSKNGARYISCSISNEIYLNNSNHDTDCKIFNYTSFIFEVGLEKKERNNGLDICDYDINLQNYSAMVSELCDSEHCKPIEMNCTSTEFVTCNYKRDIWIIIFGILINVNYILISTAFRLFDVIVVNLTKEHNADFGRQRIFSMLGSLIGPPLTGYILQKSGLTGDYKYSLAFVSASAFILISGLAMSTVNVKSNIPATKMWKQSLVLVKKLDVFLFFLLVIIMGSVFEFQLTYSSWYMQDLGASDLLLGLSRGMASLYGLPFLYSSRWFIDKIGERNLFVLGLLGHAADCFLFSFLKEPWFALAIQSLIIFSYHLFWVAVMHNIVKIVPEDLQATVTILAGTLHFNIGKIITTMIGGIVMSALGGRIAYRVLGALVSVYAVIYGIYVAKLHLRRNNTTKPEERRTDRSSEGKMGK